MTLRLETATNVLFSRTPLEPSNKQPCLCVQRDHEYWHLHRPSSKSASVCNVQAGIQNAATASAAIGLVNVVGTIIAGSMIEKAGRVQLLTVSFTGMCISMFAMVAGRSLPQLASSAGTIAFAGTVAYVLSFALGAGPVPGLLVPEINTEQMRGAQHIEDASCLPTLHLLQLAPAFLSCTCIYSLHLSSQLSPPLPACICFKLAFSACTCIYGSDVCVPA